MLIANQELPSQVRGKVGASDAVQSALVLAHVNIGQFQGETKEEFQSWLRAILVNELRTVQRRFNTEKRDVKREIGDVDANFAGAPVDPLPSPSTAAKLNEESAALRTALEKLSEEHRNVIVLRSWEELSFEEVGRRMHRSADAARKLWTRAMRQLKRSLEEQTQ